MRGTALFTRLLVVGLLGAAATPQPACADDEAAALLAKHQAYVGWELGDGSIKTLVLDGGISSSGRAGATSNTSLVHEVRSGIIFRLDITNVSTGRSAVRGFTGSKFWVSNLNGFTVTNLSDARGSILARDILFAEGTTKLPATARKHETIDGTAVVVIRETPPSGAPFDLYVDPASGAYKRMVYDPEGARPTTVDVDAYADALPGKKVVSGWHFHDSSYYYRFDKIRANESIHDAGLQPPPTTAKWTFGSGSIPLEVSPTRIYVRAVVNGIEGRFLFDTGASNIAFTDEFADRARAQRVEATTFYGINGGKRGSIAKVDTIAFADGSKLTNAKVLTGVVMGSRVDGVLGFDFLAATIADFDFDNSRLTLYNPATSAPNESQGVVVVPDLSDGTPWIPVKLDGTIPSNALLDSGAPMSVFLSRTLFARVRVIIHDQSFADEAPTELAAIQYWSGASGGIQATHCGQIGSVNIGPINYSNTAVCFTDSLPPGDSLIGIHFIEKFNLTFDYPDGKIIMQPRKDI
jgi:predicted aspartyl protease